MVCTWSAPNGNRRKPSWPSALLQAVGRLTGKLVESITVPQPSWTRALVIQVLTMLKDSLWFLDASPFPSKRFVDVLGVRLCPAKPIFLPSPSRSTCIPILCSPCVPTRSGHRCSTCTIMCDTPAVEMCHRARRSSPSRRSHCASACPSCASLAPPSSEQSSWHDHTWIKLAAQAARQM